MDRRTTGIVSTLAAIILCGIPGLVCLCSGFSSAIMSQDPVRIAESSAGVSTGTLTTIGLIGICFGVLLIAVPIIVAIIFFRRKTNRPLTDITEPLPPPS
jgi:hypothetical protein